MTSPLYSIRMHASVFGRHISGTERLVAGGEADAALREMTARALAKRMTPDSITVTVEMVTARPRVIRALEITSMPVQDHSAGRTAACRILEVTGVSEPVARLAIALLAGGPAEGGGNMRGAIIMDAVSGARLESDKRRGIRTSRFDWTDVARTKIEKELASAGLTHHRTREALALASKAAHAPGMVAELCWSDDPDYVAGYVASQKTGYVRFPALKQPNDPHGGRVYFIDMRTTDTESVIRYLQERPVLINEIGECRTMENVEAFGRAADIAASGGAGNS